jgi:tRNA U34 2-thiouridine synthase MnmA/TrmU
LFVEITKDDETGKMKALGLLSGGLDSTLATRMVLDQGLEVEAINFVSPFCLCEKGGCGAVGAAKKLNIQLKVVSVGKEYLKIIRNPKHGYGRNMNPCIDCRIFMLRWARKYAKEVGASFIFTGEVLGERPMSQHRQALEIIEREAGLKGKILRPLSAKILPRTEAEEKGWISRERLLDIKGRSRKKQIETAREFNITDYPCPGGGCLLTYKEFADKLRDLFEHKKRITLGDVLLLKVGRHFRFEENKIVVGRNESENKTLLQSKAKNDYCFEAQECGSPITLLQGRKTRRAVKAAAALTAYYSDQKTGEVHVKFNDASMEKSMLISIPSKEEVEKLRIR